MNQTSGDGGEGSTGCAGKREQFVWPKARLRSVPSMCPVALRSGRKVKELQSQPGEMQLPYGSVLLLWVGAAGWGAAAGQAGKGLVGWRNQPDGATS